MRRAAHVTVTAPSLLTPRFIRASIASRTAGVASSRRSGANRRAQPPPGAERRFHDMASSHGSGVYARALAHDPVRAAQLGGCMKTIKGENVAVGDVVVGPCRLGSVELRTGDRFTVAHVRRVAKYRLLEIDLVGCGAPGHRWRAIVADD